MKTGDVLRHITDLINEDPDRLKAEFVFLENGAGEETYISDIVWDASTGQIMCMEEI